MSNNEQNREIFLNQGAALIKSELDDQASDAVNLKQQIELRNVDLLSTSLIANSSIHQNIKSLVKERSENVRKIIAATAYFIEEEKFKSVDQAISQIELSKFDQRRLADLVESQKKISLSYSTLSAVVEIFKRANKTILDDIRQLGFADDTYKRLEKTNLYLKNAIIVYELTSFVIDYLSAFGLNGVDDLKKIQREVFTDIEKGKASDKELEKSLAKASDRLRPMMMAEIEQRNGFRAKVIQKWEDIMRQIEGQTSKAQEAKGFITDLKVIRDNSKNRIDILNLTATTTLVENSINIIGELASGIQDWELPTIDERTACELLNLEF